MDAEEVKIKGKDKFLERMKGKNPEYAPENDDMLFDDIDALYSETEAQLGKFAESNQKLAELVARDPKLGAVLSMLVGENPKSLPYAVAKVYGKDVFELEGEELEQFETGYQENLSQTEAYKSQQTEAMANIEQYKANLNKYGQENGLSEDEVSTLHDAIYADADNFLMGKIPMEYIDYKWKGMNYEKDVQEAADTGYVEGKNEKIDLKKKDAPVIPDLANATGAGANKTKAQKPKGSFFDGIKI